MLYALLSATCICLYTNAKFKHIMVSGDRQRTTLDLTSLARGWTHLAGRLAQHNEFRPQGHPTNEQDLMAQFLYLEMFSGCTSLKAALPPRWANPRLPQRIGQELWKEGKGSPLLHMKWRAVFSNFRTFCAKKDYSNVPRNQNFRRNYF